MFGEDDGGVGGEREEMKREVVCTYVVHYSCLIAVVMGFCQGRVVETESIASVERCRPSHAPLVNRKGSSR